MKRPILLGVRGEAAEFVRSAGGGLCFEPENAEHLVDTAVELMTFPDRGAGLGRIGREEVLSRFDLNVLADRYATILTTLEARDAVNRRRHRQAQGRASGRPSVTRRVDRTPLNIYALGPQSVRRTA